MVRHWIDELADNIYNALTKRGKEVYVFNGGLSVSGLQHVGRLRGEIIIAETLRKILSERGLKIKQYLTLYTQDAWKGKEQQLKQFPNPGEAARYKGNPLIRVPDPKGCHGNWVEHYWSDFGPFINEFTDGNIEVITTTDMYKDKMKQFIKLTLEKREEVRKTINKYRGRKPYSEGWIPIEPVCEKCGRIDTTEAVRLIDEDHVEYVCEHCGYKGVTEISNGKLMWRIEWVGIWWTLGVDFEPYGKDHAMPGGSRDSCVDLAVNVYGIKPPEGLPYEWVEWRTPTGQIADMGSSDFLGFTPRDWVEVAHPHIYRFIVLKTPPMKKYAVGLHEVPQYYSQYYKAERIYYGLEKAKDEEEEVILKRSYELSYPKGAPPREPPEQIPYTHLAVLAQIIPRDKWVDEGLKRLKNIGLLPAEPSRYGVQRVLETIPRAYIWAVKYGGEANVFTLNTIEEAGKKAREIPGEYIGLFIRLYEGLSTLSEWSEEAIKNIMVNITSSLEKNKVNDFYKYFYMLYIGKPSGPRAAPLLALMGREQALRYLEVFKYTK
ncbi:lysyl-tRNA synthetase [Desulfurococcus amylolyticus 1221n]|uniref:Lysine--tRNA ligase n=1 Tax=Desulfurococcus amylolyticus (strain DSM 18924 / JCM 16383 / VKM B-2413 / 1221n) TaxID=490899 RepID=B8D4B7_DESA1|nr:lysine--tRNA ligase [Desulfurococcus amylolyticus]ACL10948.1 lysyl-tRNA synthetase [Desulfurococcus amylolyticus 1221n]